MNGGRASRWLRGYVALLVAFLFSPMLFIVPVSFIAVVDRATKAFIRSV